MRPLGLQRFHPLLHMVIVQEHTKTCSGEGVVEMIYKHIVSIAVSFDPLQLSNDVYIQPATTLPFKIY